MGVRRAFRVENVVLRKILTLCDSGISSIDRVIKKPFMKRTWNAKFHELMLKTFTPQILLTLAAASSSSVIVWYVKVASLSIRFKISCDWVQFDTHSKSGAANDTKFFR